MPRAKRSGMRPRPMLLKLGVIACLLAALFGATGRAQESAPVQHTANRLVHETSPYLLQHAYNPVDWRPWSSEALAQAKRENKLILLSIGYSSCHWCHVMERLAFSDATIAAYLNQHFICIKVDREERPDLDEVYMLALQGYLKLTGQGGSGGWPLNLFLTPETHPIAGGSYFPPTDEGGRPGFLTILEQIQTAWTSRQAEVRQSAESLSQYIAKIAQPGRNSSVELSPRLVGQAAQSISAGYDSEFGGLDFEPKAPNAPKFPMTSRLQLLQAQIGVDTANSPRYAEIVETTLTAMAQGGIQDQLGGGFHRYTVDRRWKQPHFEKMLPDNALLLEVYLDAARRTGLTTHRQVVESIVQFVQSELTESTGVFRSSLDADSAGVEGQYYTWTRTDLEAALPGQDFATFAAAYGLDQPDAFSSPVVLALPRPIAQTARQLRMPVADLETRLAEMRQKLLASRAERPSVLRDDKILTGWNGLMIHALARAGSTLDRSDWVRAAEKAGLYLLANHRDEHGELLRCSRQGVAHIPGFLDDYAYLTSGMLALHEATGEDKWLSAARRLMDSQIRLFWDNEAGGFFSTSSTHEPLLLRTKSAYDDSLPAPNGVSLRNLVKLARMTHEDRFRELAERTARAFAPQLAETPANLGTLALGLQEHLHWFGNSAPRQVQEDLFGDRSQPLNGLLAQGPPPRGPAPAAEKPLVPALKATPEDAALHKQVSAAIYFDAERLTPGRRARVAIELKVARGWHVNANPPSPDVMIPTKVTLKSLGKLELKDVKYPAGKPFKVSGIDEALSVYEGTVYITGVLEVPANWQGNEDLTAEVEYQACNDQSCLRPTKIPLSGKVQTTGGAAAAEPFNKALFDKLFPPARN